MVHLSRAAFFFFLKKQRSVCVLLLLTVAEATARVYVSTKGAVVRLLKLKQQHGWT